MGNKGAEAGKRKINIRKNRREKNKIKIKIEKFEKRKQKKTDSIRFTIIVKGKIRTTTVHRVGTHSVKKKEEYTEKTRKHTTTTKNGGKGFSCGGAGRPSSM